MDSIRWTKDVDGGWLSKQRNEYGEAWVIDRDADGYLLSFGGHSFGWYRRQGDAKNVAHHINVLSRDFSV